MEPTQELKAVAENFIEAKLHNGKIEVRTFGTVKLSADDARELIKHVADLVDKLEANR